MAEVGLDGEREVVAQELPGAGHGVTRDHSIRGEDPVGSPVVVPACIGSRRLVCRPGYRVGALGDSVCMLRDLVRVRVNAWRGRYDLGG